MRTPSAADYSFRSTRTPAGKVLNIALWAVQFLLALAFGFAGVMKSTQPLAELAQGMPWTQVVPPFMVRFIGISEFLGALGLILPSLTRIKPGLTPLAAAGLTVIMVLAMGYHLVRGEMSSVAPSLILGALSAFVAWGRFSKAPIEPRR